MFTVISVSKTIHQYLSDTWSIKAMVEPKYQWKVKQYSILTWLALFWLILNWHSTNTQSIYRQCWPILKRYSSSSQDSRVVLDRYLIDIWPTLSWYGYVGRVSAKGQPILGRHIGRVTGQESADRVSWHYLLNKKYRRQYLNKITKAVKTHLL